MHVLMYVRISTAAGKYQLSFAISYVRLLGLTIEFYLATQYHLAHIYFLCRHVLGCRFAFLEISESVYRYIFGG